MRKLLWREINHQNISTSSGIYAWYYDHKIGNHDIQSFLSTINQLTSPVSRRECVKEFLNRRIFNHYQEQPYKAVITGKLKPKYSGLLYHQIDVSENLVERIVDNPDIVERLSDVLEEVSYSFMSPLYIGMAKNLSARLVRHKLLIEKYRADGVPSTIEKTEEYMDRDHNFAVRVIEKDFIETNLYVLTKEVEGQFSIHNIIEHILNRINYPILGRN